MTSSHIRSSGIRANAWGCLGARHTYGVGGRIVGYAVVALVLAAGTVGVWAVQHFIAYEQPVMVVTSIGVGDTEMEGKNSLADRLAGVAASLRSENIQTSTSRITTEKIGDRWRAEGSLTLRGETEDLREVRVPGVVRVSGGSQLGESSAESLAVFGESAGWLLVSLVCGWVAVVLNGLLAAVYRGVWPVWCGVCVVLYVVVVVLYLQRAGFA